MKKKVPGIAIILLIVFSACTKKTENIQPREEDVPSKQKIFACGARLLPPGRRGASMLKTAGNSTSPVVLLLDFNGQRVVNSAWMNPGTINCPAVPSSLLSSVMRDFIVNSVTEDFSCYHVKVTLNEADYNAAAAGRRIRCIITYNMSSIFGHVGGVSIIGSLLTTDAAPSFIFCDELDYNQRYIAGAVAHELGHTFGLQHQSRYSSNCMLEEEFHSGFGSGQLGWAPIMGLSYYQQIVTWHKGSSILGCGQVQNDMDVIAGIAGAKADDYGTAMNSSAVVLPAAGSRAGVIETPNDRDVFMKNENGSKRVRITPGGNSDIALEVYNTNGQLTNVYDDGNGTGINVVITGKKYFKLRLSSAQPFVPQGDGGGSYVINISNP